MEDLHVGTHSLAENPRKGDISHNAFTRCVPPGSPPRYPVFPRSSVFVLLVYSIDNYARKYDSHANDARDFGFCANSLILSVACEAGARDVAHVQPVGIFLPLHTLMAALLGEWVASALSLSKPITSFERDLSNGVVFGEVLVALGLAPESISEKLTDAHSVSAEEYPPSMCKRPVR